MSKKHQVLLALYANCKRSGNFVFHNDAVKDICREVGFGNAFDVTKIDNSDLLPEEFRQGTGIYVVHLGKGSHQFVHDISTGYHSFEDIEEKEQIDWNYLQSVLNEYDTSESNILSVGYNQRTLQDFLYSDITANPKIYMSRRTFFTGTYTVNGLPVSVKRLQMEIDMVLELGGKVTILEGKNGFPRDFAVYQLFHPHLYYQDLGLNNELALTEIQCCYLLRKDRKLRLFLYRFHEKEKNSVELLKKAEYLLNFRTGS